MSGHASHDGNSVKPNTNAEERIDTAADVAVDPNAMVPPKGEAEVRSRRAPENKKATQRAPKQ